ncbi:MAG: LysR family transcriptional regulator [Myxococcota bacterium]
MVLVTSTLTLDQLRVLVTIADSGSFSAAGRALFRAQSAVSQAVATLEAHQGVTLFDRSGYRPQLTEVGRVLVDQARLVLASAARFEAVAAGTRVGLEAELAVAIDPLVPSEPLVDTLRDLSHTFPDLPLRFSTEGLGGSLRSLRRDVVSLAICLLLPAVPEDIVAYPLLKVPLRPVVAPSHPLAALTRPARPDDLESHIQLVLSDPVEPEEANYGVVSARLWRFVDLSRRLDVLSAGFGWCRMPEHLIREHLADGSLIVFQIEHDSTPVEGLTIYAAHRKDRTLGPAGHWLLSALRQRFTAVFTTPDAR